jgi:O-antigen ligase
VTARAGRLSGLIAIALLQLYWYAQDVPVPLKIITGLFTAACLASPRAGLLLLAVLAPVSTRLSLQWGGTSPPGLLLEQMVLAACAGGLVWLGPRMATRIGAPAALVAAVALGSAAAMWPALAAATAPPGIDHTPGIVWQQLLVRRDAGNTAVWSPVFAALMVAESCLLGWLAEREARRSPGFVSRLLWMLLAGHAAAALLSIEQIIEVAYVSGGGLHALPRALLDVRLSTEMDVHAAGSAFLLAAVAGAGLVRGRLPHRVAAAALVLVIGLGLWITGSRFALAGAALAAAIALGLWARRFSWRRIAVAGLAISVVLAAGWFAVVPKTARYNELSNSVQTRLLIAQASLRLFTTAPVFGIGIDQLHDASERVVDPAFRELSGYARQNAHNNFLQTLAELGVVGLAVMLFWLAALFGGAWRAETADRRRDALAVGVVACLATWLAGHPLLVREFSTAFWLYAALLAALSAPLTAAWSRGAAIVISLLLVTLPIRAAVLRNGADLEHLGYGLSLWQDDGERRYREASRQFHLYLPTGAAVRLPMRLAPAIAGPETATVRLDEETLATVTLSRDQWQLVDVQLPAGRSRFVLVTVSLSGVSASSGTPVVRVGRVEPR